MTKICLSFFLCLLFCTSAFAEWTDWRYLDHSGYVEIQVRFKHHNNKSKAQFRVKNNTSSRKIISVNDIQYYLSNGDIEKGTGVSVTLPPDKSYTFISDGYCDGIISRVSVFLDVTEVD